MTTSNRVPALHLTRCPQCGAAAKIERRAVLESRDGPTEHAAARCVARHWFLMPTAELAIDTLTAPQTVAPIHPRT